MLRKIPEIAQPFTPYNERYSATFINYEQGFIPQIAEGVHINGLVDCLGQVTIEKDVFTGHDVMILTSSHDYEKFGEERKQTFIAEPVHIQQGAWLSSRCIILPGVTIGKHSVIGAGAVVTHNVPAYEMWLGNPAKCIKKYNHEKKLWKAV